MEKTSLFTIESNVPLTSSVYRMELTGDTSRITAPGQFVNIALTGKFLRRPISVCDYAPGRRAPRYDALRLGVTWDRETLKKRIDERLERRLAQGMVQETKALLDEGVSEQDIHKIFYENPQRWLAVF